MSLIATLRRPRLFGIALFDVIASFLGIYALLRFFFPRRPRAFAAAWSVVATLPLAVATHVAFRIPTTLNADLGLSAYPIN